MKARIMTRTGRANTIIGAIIVVLLALALGYYFTGNQQYTAGAPGAPAAADTTNTGSTNQ